MRCGSETQSHCTLRGLNEVKKWNAIAEYSSLTIEATSTRDVLKPRKLVRKCHEKCEESHDVIPH